MTKTYEFTNDKEYIDFLEWQTKRNSQNVQAHLDTIDGKIKDLYFKVDLHFKLSQQRDDQSDHDIKEIRDLLPANWPDLIEITTKLNDIIIRIEKLEKQNILLMGQPKEG